LKRSFYRTVRTLRLLRPPLDARLSPDLDKPSWSWVHGLVGWAVCFAGVSVVFSLVGPNPYDLIRIETSGATTTGVVTGFDANNHQECEYAYTVAGRRYAASGNGGRTSADKLLGAPVAVTYLPSRPSVSEDGSPTADLRNFAFFSLGLATLAGLFSASPHGWRRGR
jgi:hypothetical protein